MITEKGVNQDEEMAEGNTCHPVQHLYGSGKAR